MSTTYYVLVENAHVKGSTETGFASAFSIAFYESQASIQLRQGIAERDRVASDQRKYFVAELHDVNSDYEI